jgi:spore maturation protein A
MINLIWVTLMVIGIVYAGIHGRIDLVTLNAISAAENAVQLSFKLMGVMCLWLGMMKIAEKAGLAKGVAILLGPLLRWLFPSVPRQHPAMGAIIMTVSANMLGLGNAVTPLGIKAMQELNKLNDDKQSASAAMCTLVALCTTGFTLVPATIIALRAAAGSSEPAAIAGPTLVVSLIGTLVVLIVDRCCRAIYGPSSRRY